MHVFSGIQDFFTTRLLAKSDLIHLFEVWFTLKILRLFGSVGGKPKNRLGNRSVGYPQAQEPCGGYTRHGRERYQEQKL